MPHHKSAEKRLRTADKARIFNRSLKRTFRPLVKDLRETESATDAKALVPQVQSALDKARKHSVLKKNTVSRLKSRLARRANALAAAK